jgi:hypothetical protein
MRRLWRARRRRIDLARHGMHKLGWIGLDTAIYVTERVYNLDYSMYEKL